MSVISREDAINHIKAYRDEFKEDFGIDSEEGDDASHYFGYIAGLNRATRIIDGLPSVQLTLSGYNIEHLALIARLLQKENLPPEKIVEALTDIGRIVSIIKDEFEETLRKAVEQCTI